MSSYRTDSNNITEVASYVAVYILAGVGTTASSPPALTWFKRSFKLHLMLFGCHNILRRSFDVPTERKKSGFPTQSTDWWGVGTCAGHHPLEGFLAGQK